MAKVYLNLVYIQYVNTQVYLYRHVIVSIFYSIKKKYKFLDSERSDGFIYVTIIMFFFF